MSRLFLASFALFFNPSCVTASERPESSLTIGSLHSAITGLSTVGRSKKRMSGAERKKAAQKARKKLVKEMDEYQERSESRCASRVGSRPGSRSGSISRMNRSILVDSELNAKQAGADFSMDELARKLSGRKKNLFLDFKIQFQAPFRKSTTVSAAALLRLAR